jgi:hypothetical protein
MVSAAPPPPATTPLHVWVQEGNRFDTAGTTVPRRARNRAVRGARVYKTGANAANEGQPSGVGLFDAAVPASLGKFQ